MKASTKNPSANKLVAKFENDLLVILFEDLRNLKLKRQYLNNGQVAAA